MSPAVYVNTFEMKSTCIWIIFCLLVHSSGIFVQGWENEQLLKLAVLQEKSHSNVRTARKGLHSVQIFKNTNTFTRESNRIRAECVFKRSHNRVICGSTRWCTTTLRNSYASSATRATCRKSVWLNTNKSAG